MLRSCPSTPRKQRGVTLFITLIALVVMTLAAIGLVRSVDTGTLIAGNISFRQSGVLSGDLGMESAVTWLGAASATTLEANNPADGYYAADPCPANPALCADEAAYYQDRFDANEMKTLAKDGAKNTVSYIIQRMCANSGSATTASTYCVTSASTSVPEGSDQHVGNRQVEGPSRVYYRITARVAGPKNTVSYTQSIVLM